MAFFNHMQAKNEPVVRQIEVSITECDTPNDMHDHLAESDVLNILMGVWNPSDIDSFEATLDNDRWLVTLSEGMGFHVLTHGADATTRYHGRVYSVYVEPAAR